ncbi:hypothetical protein QBC33DRAFT_548737 [Phialemonium atrogriseum]|uniref:Uncharacterized protein n=1 Tax=Phialemonium atrogriseum TaxID=1093897 RepID=A0AAJ0BTC6_9PEZI|nr:uncharacterized protein QBC33DRAFT_548737 [Phialemonium atrogriseum]KAK1763846.1 hypothetical protein QBC33DRAFT_548737 [Phialemonium atrogriseum]
MLESHGVSSDGKDFLDVPNPNLGPAKKHPGTFQCTLCPMRFIRTHNLPSDEASSID